MAKAEQGNSIHPCTIVSLVLCKVDGILARRFFFLVSIMEALYQYFLVV